MPKTVALLLLIFALVASAPGRADAHTVHFLGAHPIAAKYGGGFCLIEAPHLHIYPPDHPNLYQRVGDQVVFTADPTPFGYEGEKHPFYGHHPVRMVDGEPVFCYIDGPHYHGFEAPDGHDYETRKGVAFYVGAFPPSYAKLRPARARAINAEYRPYVSLRPTIEVTPPDHWRGEVWRGPGVEVIAPGVVIGSPEVEVSGPGIAVMGPPGILIGGPSVVVDSPGVYVEGSGRGHRGERFEERDHEERDHHDNGRHEGWFKHEGDHHEGEHHEGERHEGEHHGHH
jgi:hypothetical protein